MDDNFFNLALELARQGVGFTSPNPAVGAVIVRKGRVIATGYHKKAGKDHAEVIVIKKVKNKNLLREAELYVTLEPCCHYGKTPPCVDLIVRSGIKKVYVGMIDPFEKVKGKGVKYLRKNGVEVKLCKNKKIIDEIENINKPFIKVSKFGLPYVLLKAAISLDGKIATSIGDSKWISNNKARGGARLERSHCDAVMVGSGTVKHDNPELAPHGKFKKKKLLRIILDSDLSTSVKAHVYRDENVFVACTNLAGKNQKNRFDKANIEYKSFGEEKINIKKLLVFLAQRNVQKIFVEGGSEVHGSFVDAHRKFGNIADEIVLYVASKIIGGREAKTVVGGEGAKFISNSLSVKNVSYQVLDDNLKISGNIF